MGEPEEYVATVPTCQLPKMADTSLCTGKRGVV